MKIIQVTPGSGDAFYCENCLRDYGLVRALRAAGHDAMMVPLYLAPNTDGLPPERDESSDVFFGAVNVYLQQKSRLFRRTPRWIDRLFDAPWLLRLAGRLAGSTDASELGDTTLSMLRGEDGRQVKELDRLVEHLAGEAPPDVVCLSNALLAGLARKLRRRLGAAVVCMLQDEDEFIDALPPDERDAAWDVLRERTGDVDAFVAASRYYADAMTERLRLAPARVHVVHNGVDAEALTPAPDRGETDASAPTIGYLSRMHADKGLDLLVEAMAILRADARFADTRLAAAGGATATDEPFLRTVRRRVSQLGLDGVVEFRDNPPLHRRVEFLRPLTVLSVPERRGEAGGRYVLEALACGVPVVQPNNGAFPELIRETGGGVLFEPGDAGALAGALASVLGDPQRRTELGERGRRVVAERFTIARAAGEMIDVMRSAADADREAAGD